MQEIKTRVCNPSTGTVEAGEFVHLRPYWVTQPTLFQKAKLQPLLIIIITIIINSLALAFIYCSDPCTYFNSMALVGILYTGYLITIS